MAKPDSNQTTPLWSYIRLGQYAPPTGPAAETVHQGLKYLWNRLRQVRDWNDTQDKASQVELHSLSETFLDQVSSPPDWVEASIALGDTLSELLSLAQHPSNTQVIVTAPDSSTAQITNQWAQSQGWSIMAPPTPEQILSSGDEWLNHTLKGQKSCAFIPRLERFFLRHPDGFSLVRKLFERVMNSSRIYVMECGSWGWAYLSMALDVDDLFPEPLTLEAFDHLRLERWFWSLCTVVEGIAFRQADNGRHVLTPRGVESEESDTETSDFLKHLAAYSRGIPEVARTVWRYSLQSAADEGTDGAREISDKDDGRSTVWVRPWSQLKLPTMPGWVDQPDLFLLHALLTHGGLPAHILADVLPMTIADVIRSLHRLRGVGLLQEDSKAWRVSPLAYPAVRQYLNSEGYLVDAF